MSPEDKLRAELRAEPRAELRAKLAQSRDRSRNQSLLASSLLPQARGRCVYADVRSFGSVERDFEVQRTIKSLLLFDCVLRVLRRRELMADRDWRSLIVQKRYPQYLSDVTVRKMVDICDGGHGTGKFTTELVLLH